MPTDLLCDKLRGTICDARIDIPEIRMGPKEGGKLSARYVEKCTGDGAWLRQEPVINVGKKVTSLSPA